MTKPPFNCWADVEHLLRNAAALQHASDVGLLWVALSASRLVRNNPFIFRAEAMLTTRVGREV